MVHHFFASVSPVYCKKLDSIQTKLTEEIDFEVCPMAIPAMALLQQHDTRRDILTEPAARRRTAIEARGHLELGAFGTGHVRNWGRNRAVKTNRLVGLSVRVVSPVQTA